MGTESIPNSKEAVAAESPSDLELQIIRQIEYYFGNYNLSRDKFLREQVKLDDGWVPLETMVKFNRLKKLSDDFSVISEALKKSSKQLMEVNEDCTKIRRRTAEPLPEEYRAKQDELDARTLYVKGFKKNNSLDELLEFFRDHEVEHVFMRRNMQQNTKPFKGSVFVTFETKEGAEKFLERKGIKYCGTELLKEWKKDYVKRKDELYQSYREQKEKKMLMKAGLVKKEGDENKEGGDAVKEEPEDMEESNDNEEPKDMVRGCLLKLSNLSKECNREQIKDAFEPYGLIVYVDYHYGNPAGVIRFESPIANTVYEKLPEEDGEKRIEIASSKVLVTKCEGNEEEEYWKLIKVSRAKSRQALSTKRKFGNKGSGNRGRFKKWGNRKGKNRNDQDDKAEPPLKKIKIEASTNNEKSSANMDVSTDPPEVKKETPEVKKETSEVKTES